MLLYGTGQTNPPDDLDDDEHMRNPLPPPRPQYLLVPTNPKDRHKLVTRISGWGPFKKYSTICGKCGLSEDLANMFTTCRGVEKSNLPIPHNPIKDETPL